MEDLLGRAHEATEAMVDRALATAPLERTMLDFAALLSPAAGEVKVSWHRSAIHVKPAEGWKRNRVYHLELLPGITDRRRNVMKKGATVVFATGPAPPQASASLTGTALLWVEQRMLPGAVIRAAPIPDTVAYVAIADSAGDFRLAAIPPGRYLVWVIQDQNNNRQLDRREAFDSTTVTVDSTASAVLFAFPHDSAGPRIKSVEPVDSLAMGVSFSQPLDPRRMPDTARVRVFALPDTTPVPVKTVLAQADYDSIRAKAQAAADSLQRARDTTARKDTTARRAPAGAPTPPARPPSRPRLPAPPSRAPAGRDTTATPVDTARIRQLLKQRPVPADRIVVQTATPLAPGAKYLVRVRGATNLNGATADAQGVLAVPTPKPAARDAGSARRDTTKSP